MVRAAKFYMAAQVETGHLCPITMTRASVAALAAQPDLLAKAMPVIATRAYDPDFAPWWTKRGMTLGMGMTEKQGGTDVRSNMTRADARRRRLSHHRAQMVHVGADVRRVPGAGAGRRRLDLFLHAALQAGRIGQCDPVPAPEGQTRQPLQCIVRGGIRRRLCEARRRRGQGHPHHHPDGAADAAGLRDRLRRPDAVRAWRMRCITPDIAACSRSISPISR